MVNNLRKLGVVLGVVLLALLVAPAGASATANNIIYSRWDGRCVDADVATPTHNGTQIQIWDCNDWNNQNWSYFTDFTLRSSHDGRCLDEDLGSPTHNGTKVQLWDCNG